MRLFDGVTLVIIRRGVVQLYHFFTRIVARILHGHGHVDRVIRLDGASVRLVKNSKRTQAPQIHVSSDSKAHHDGLLLLRDFRKV